MTTVGQRRDTVGQCYDNLSQRRDNPQPEPRHLRPGRRTSLFSGNKSGVPIHTRTGGINAFG
jgi:hypothetical protein